LLQSLPPASEVARATWLDTGVSPCLMKLQPRARCAIKCGFRKLKSVSSLERRHYDVAPLGGKVNAASRAGNEIEFSFLMSYLMVIAAHIATFALSPRTHDFSRRAREARNGFELVTRRTT
jgi:hypothetical protein